VKKALVGRRPFHADGRAEEQIVPFIHCS
jgi:hypothetical protein